MDFSWPADIWLPAGELGELASGTLLAEVWLIGGWLGVDGLKIFESKLLGAHEPSDLGLASAIAACSANQPSQEIHWPRSTLDFANGCALASSVRRMLEH